MVIFVLGLRAEWIHKFRMLHSRGNPKARIEERVREKIGKEREVEGRSKASTCQVGKRISRESPNETHMCFAVRDHLLVASNSFSQTPTWRIISHLNIGNIVSLYLNNYGP